MDEQFIFSQYQVLKKLLNENKNTRLSQSLDLSYLTHEDDLEMIHLQMCENIPVFDYEGYMLYLKRLLDMPTMDNETVLAGKNVIAAERAFGLYRYKDHVYPVTKNYYKNYFQQVFKYLRGGIDNLPSLKKGTFYLLDDATLTRFHDLQIGELTSLMSSKWSYFQRKKSFPVEGDMKNIGKSHYQKVHGYLELLKKYGQELSLMVARPEMLEDVFQLIVSKERRDVRIKEICPHLKVVVFYEGATDLQRQNLERFLDEDIIIIDLFLEPHELVGMQVSRLDQGVVTIHDAGEIFYSFVHENDLKSDGRPKENHTRLHYGELQLGENYLPLVSNLSGFMMHQSYKIFKVESLSPFKMRFIRDSRILDHFGEHISTSQVDLCVNKVNRMKASYGLSVRKYMIGGNTYSGEMNWLFEIDANVKNVQQELFKNVANTLHTEMMIANSQYKEGVIKGKIPLPTVTFVSVGSFSLVMPMIDLARIDLTDNAELVEKLKDSLDEKISLKPNDQFSSHLSVEDFE